jgi:hypothetical protein
MSAVTPVVRHTTSGLAIGLMVAVAGPFLVQLVLAPDPAIRGSFGHRCAAQRSASNQLSNYGGVQTRTYPARRVPVDAHSALAAVRRACFGTKGSRAVPA